MKKLLLVAICLMAITSFSKNKTWMCLQEDGSVAFQLEAKYVYDFNEGFAPVKVSSIVNNQWVYNIGFVNKKGEFSVPPRYKKTKGSGFTNGVAWVQKHDSDYWTLIDTTGREIPTKNYEKVGYIFKNNFDLIAVYRNDQLGFINLKGEEVIPCKYLGGTFFAHGLACVTPYESKEEKYGFINPKGEIAIPFQFKQAGMATFEDNGMCRANVAGKTVLIDKSGKIVFKTDKGNIQGVSNNWVRVFTKKDRSGWGFLSFDDQWMIQPKYDDLDEFNTLGYSAARKNGLVGLIDTADQTLISFKYETIYADPESFLITALYPTAEPESMINTPKDYYNQNFERIEIPEKLHYVYGTDKGKLIRYQTDNKMIGYLNKQLTIVIPAVYKRANAFNDGLAWVSKL